MPAVAAEALTRWQAEQLRRPGIRIVPPDHLHVTLAFLGARPATELDELVAVLQDAAASQRRPALEAERYRETERVAMLVFTDEEGRAAALQAGLSARLELLGVYRPEARAWLPHVTVARFSARPRLGLAPPELGVVTPTEAALYRSTLARTGATYEVLASAQLARIGDGPGATP